MTKQQILDLYFLDARHKLVELAAFLDRVERADGKDDFRLKSFRAALGELAGKKKKKRKMFCSRSATRPSSRLPKPQGKGATGAFANKFAVIHQLTLNRESENSKCATSSRTPTWSAARRMITNAWRSPVARRSASRRFGRASTAARVEGFHDYFSPAHGTRAEARREIRPETFLLALHQFQGSRGREARGGSHRADPEISGSAKRPGHRRNRPEQKFAERIARSGNAGGTRREISTN